MMQTTDLRNGDYLPRLGGQSACRTTESGRSQRSVAIAGMCTRLEGNWTWDCFLASTWQNPDGERLLVRVNYVLTKASVTSVCHSPTLRAANCALWIK
jgi:hypothetical protein